MLMVVVCLLMPLALQGAVRRTLWTQKSPWGAQTQLKSALWSDMQEDR